MLEGHMAEKHFVPRWRYQRVEIPAGETVEADPVPFSNTEVWPWDLRFLSLVGEPNVEEASAPFDTVVGGLGARLRFKLSISQWSSVNLVPVSGLAMMPHLHSPLSLPSWTLAASAFKFDLPVILGPDDAIVAEVQNTDPVGNYKDFSLVFNGTRNREDGSKQPDQLAGIYQEELGPGVSDTLDDADLYNDGESDFHLHEMLLDASLAPVANVYGNKARWRINPSTGIMWMDRNELIPEGNICPFNRPGLDRYDRGPRAYEFPKQTILRRRQRLTLKVENLSDVLQVADLALFGYLEVS
jgi:hypothetical protein